MKRIAALAISIPALMAQSEQSPLHNVTAVRHWSLPDVTRVAIEVTGDFKYRSDHLHNPERVYFDVLNSRPRFENKRIFTEHIDDRFLQRVRVAETTPGITRVVLDLSGPVEVNTSQLNNPNRLMIELRAGAPSVPTEPPAISSKAPVLPSSIVPDSATPPKPPPARTEAKVQPAAEPAKAQTPPNVQSKAPAVVKADAPVQASAEPNKEQTTPDTSQATADASKALVAAAKVSAASDIPEKPAASSRFPSAAAPAAESPKPDTSKTGGGSSAVAELGKAARHTSTGDTSLVRVLGLKVGRVVIDPGHGGHDQGTEGPHGLLEKELVLDVALRVGKLIEDRMNAEVIYTRTDDTFIPLEGRTALANEKKADLFLSIHANSSPVPRISGVEVYYLNFATSKDSMDVASRENATSQRSIFDLQDLVQKITLHDKVEESHEFASRLQSSLFAFSSKSFPAEKNRGVKKAPFVVLIGATMPSILAEIGFLSNTREEALLKKPDYRQKLAEALFRGISRYADTLSHFQVAKNQQ
jgi:N-acetylmuramoyl-L-alanine amidase